MFKDRKKKQKNPKENKACAAWNIDFFRILFSYATLPFSLSLRRLSYSKIPNQRLCKI